MDPAAGSSPPSGRSAACRLHRACGSKLTGRSVPGNSAALVPVIVVVIMPVIVTMVMVMLVVMVVAVIVMRVADSVVGFVLGQELLLGDGLVRHRGKLEDVVDDLLLEDRRAQRLQGVRVLAVVLEDLLLLPADSGAPGRRARAAAPRRSR